MVSRSRMKIDLIGQIVLIVALLINLAFVSNMPWSRYLLALLIVWQFASACHLYFAYRYVKKLGFLRIGIVVIISLFVWVRIIGFWAYIPILGLVLWYFLQTIIDTRIVISRPRHFWDLF